MIKFLTQGQVQPGVEISTLLAEAGLAHGLKILSCNHAFDYDSMHFVL
jgi:hypothetical protein